MSSTKMFGSVVTLADLPDDELKAYLLEVGEQDAVDALVAAESGGQAAPETFGGGAGLFGRFLYPFRNVTHVTGFFTGGGELRPVSRAEGPSVSDDPVRIFLDALHVSKYPGSGTHEILFEATLSPFQASEGAEPVHFAKTLRAARGSAAIGGWPLFTDVHASDGGILLGFQTVNLSSSFNKRLLAALDSSAFNVGLSLVSTVQPAAAQVSKLVRGVVEWSVGESSNRAVQQADVGLDFRSPGSPGGRLAEGSYTFIQLPSVLADTWHFGDWQWDDQRATIVSGQTGEPLDANFVVISVHRQQ